MLGLTLGERISKLGLQKVKRIQRAPLPEQLSLPEGGLQNYLQPTPRHEVYGGDLTYYNFWYGNQMPGSHIFTQTHAWYETGHRSAYQDISVQRSAAYFGQVVSVLDTARLQAAARAAWAKLASNNG
jgi:hypothetical protein